MLLKNASLQVQSPFAVGPSTLLKFLDGRVRTGCKFDKESRRSRFWLVWVLDCRVPQRLSFSFKLRRSLPHHHEWWYGELLQQNFFDMPRN
jgi:hypothetical protein